MADTAKEWALELARRGLPVFPIKPGTKDPYLASNTSGKHTALTGGIHIATTEVAKVERWFEIEPAMNYGVSTRDLVVLDADAAHGKLGVESLKAFDLPETFRVASPRDGLHIYFKGPGAGQRGIAPGIDVRSVGGYVVGPGSIFEGKPYRALCTADLAELPGEIRERLSAPGERPDVADAIGDIDPPGSWDLAVSYLMRETGALKGERGITAYKLAARLKDLALSETSAYEVLSMYWSDRCEPPMDPGELQASVTHAYTYGRNAQGSDNPLLEFEAIPEDLRGPPPEPPAPKVSEGNFKLLDLSDGPAALPERPWLLPDVLMRGALTGLISPPGVGKSTFTLALAIGLALGQLEWLGFPGTYEPTTVVLINNEDDEDEVKRRVYAMCEGNGLDWTKLEGRLIIHAAPDGSGFVGIGRSRKTRALGTTARFRELDKVLGDNKAGLFIGDPYVELHEGEENDNGETALVMKTFRALARRHKIPGLLVHHTRKPPLASSDSYAGDANSARGALAFVGNVRVLYTLYGMSKDDAERYGVSERERHQYSRLDPGKGSYSEGGRPAKWYRTRSRQLLNGDNAPTVEHVTLSDRMANLGLELHELLADAVMVSGSLTLKEAVALLREDSFFGKTKAADLTEKLAEQFELSVPHNGVTLVVEGRGKARRLTGWRNDNEGEKT